MQPIVREVNIHRGAPSQALVWSPGVVLVFPELELIPPVFGIDKPQAVKQLLIVRAMTAFDDAVLPRRARSAQTMNHVQGRDRSIKSGQSLGVPTVLHREFDGVVGPNEKKGGSRSKARRKTPATVAER